MRFGHRASNTFTERMRIDASGNVGIGVSSPAERLDVAGNAKITSGSSFYWGDATSQITATNGGAMRFLVGNGGEKVRISSAGDVSIGTTSGGAGLYVVPRASVPYSIFDTASAGFGYSAFSYNGTNYGFIGQATGLLGTGTNTDLAIRADANMLFGIGSTERMRIDSSGNVGIGITSPAYRLDVNGVTRLGAGSPAILAGVGGAFVGGQGELYTTGTNTMGLGTTGAASMQFYTNSVERMRINSAGNIGLGTTNILARFTVGGGNGIVVFDNGASGLNQAQFANDSGIALAVGVGGSTNATWKQNLAHVSVTSNQPLAFATNNTERMRLTNVGTLLVGTTSAQTGSKVQVRANYSAGEFFSAYCALPSGTSGGGGLTMGAIDIDNSQIASGSEYNSAGLHYAFGTTASNIAQISGTISFFTNAGLTAATTFTPTERMRIDSSGNVGIGTSSPTSLLHVYNSGSGDAGVRIGNAQNGITTDIGRQGAAAYGATGAGEGFVYSGGPMAIMADSGSGIIKFATGGPTERARIDTSGNLLVGTTTTTVTNGGIAAQPNYDGTGISAIEIGHPSAASGGARYLIFSLNNVFAGSVTQGAGNTVAFNTSSDARLKENIADADDASSLIDAIQVRKFDWKTDNSHQRYGFVAQELVDVVPEAVTNLIDPEEMMGVDYSKLVPMLVKELQSLRARVAQLEGN
jgi:hypothetical protein